MGKWYEFLHNWALEKVALANWERLYDWFADTTQKIGIGGVVLGLFKNNPTGSIIGAMLLFISAIISLASKRR